MSAGFRFRSPFLKALPSGLATLSGQVLARRWGWFAGVVLALGLLVTAVSRRAFAVDGPMRWLYWLHDHLFLPIKGFTWSLLYPYSLLWWGLLAIALAWFAVSYLGVRRSWRGPHVFVTRVMLENRGLHNWLVGVARMLHTRGADLLALRLTTVDLWQQTLEQCQRPERPSSEQWTFRQATSLASLMVKLEQLRLEFANRDAEEPEQLDVTLLNLWLETYLEVQRGAVGSAHRQFFAELQRELALTLAPLLPLPEQDLDAGLFARERLCQDLHLLLLVAHPELAQRSKRYAKLEGQRRAQLLLQRAARHYEQRMQLLVRQAREWEAYSFNLGGALSDADDDVDPANDCGALATWLAFLLAALGEKLEAAESWMDALDLLALYAGQQRAAELPPLAHLPSLPQLNLLRRMQQTQHERQLLLWKQTPFRDLTANVEPQQRVQTLAVRPDGEV